MAYIHEEIYIKKAKKMIIGLIHKGKSKTSTNVYTFSFKNIYEHFM